MPQEINIKKIICNEYTEFDCIYEIEESLNELVKYKFKKHLKEQHRDQGMEQMSITRRQIRRVIGNVDTQIMGRNKQHIYNYNMI